MSRQFKPESPEPIKTESDGMAAKWKKASTAWAREVNSGYISNPTARKDFRVQFRGKNSISVFGFVLLIFGGTSLYMFWQVSQSGLSPGEIQEKLGLFCDVILSILGVAVTLIAPALAAASILAEKQRQSLDLVFSSPVKPFHYLFGKLLASYRYVWVLMALSLPFTAMSVVMGGASWVNILECYFLLSIQGLLFTTIGIYFSALVEKTLAALLYTYIAVIGFCAGMFALCLLSKPENLSAPFQGGPWPFAGSLAPVLVEFASGSFTRIFGIPIPNTIIATLFVGGAVNLILRAAGGLLSPLRDRERTSLRIQCGVILTAISGYLGFLEIPGVSTSLIREPNVSLFLVATLPLLVFVPFLACYSSDAERSQRHSKLFAWKDAFGKSVAGALPYIYSVLASSSVSFLIGSALSHKTLDLGSANFILYTFGFWTFVWSTARFSSSFLLGIKASRTLQFLTFAGLVGTPLPIFWALGSLHGYDPDYVRKLWAFNPVGPFLYNADFWPTLIHGILLGTTGISLALWSESNFRKRLEQRKIARMAEETPLSSTPDLLGLGDLAKDGELMQRLVQGA